MFKRKTAPPEPEAKPKPKAKPVDWAREIGEIEIFRAGTFRAMNGKEYSFTAKDVAQIANAFDPIKAPVPVVIGHPKADEPAYAWLEDVYADGDMLYATLEKVDPEFGEIVKAGRYKRISSAFYPPDADNNPMPGQYYLRHVGFLGAAAPAVQGLKSVDLAGDENDWLAFGERLSQSAIAKHYERQIRLLHSERDVDKLIEQGKVLPRDKEGLLAFMSLLDKSTMIAFADGEDERTMSEWFTGFLQGQMPQVVYGEMDLGPDPSVAQSAQFAAPEGHKVDQAALDLHAKATQIMREKGVRFEDALELVHGD